MGETTLGWNNEVEEKQEESNDNENDLKEESTFTKSKAADQI